MLSNQGQNTLSTPNHTSQIGRLLHKVLKEITPSKKERQVMQDKINPLLKSLEETGRKHGLDYQIEVVGSYARDTWIAGQADADIFLLFPPRTPLKELQRQALQTAKEAVEAIGGIYVEQYAQHPYIEACLVMKRENRRAEATVDIVPAYAIKDPENIKSAVDRSPFHTRYLKTKLDDQLRSQIRLLKKFLLGIGAYGAEIKTGGFSGYLTELLILRHRNFINLLEQAQNWKPENLFIDIEDHYEHKSKKQKRRLAERFSGAVTVIDPVDKNRNVASALTTQKLSEFIAAARGFLAHPRMTYFQPREPKPTTTKDYKETLRRRGTGIMALKITIPPLAEDILWGEIQHSQRAITKLLTRHQFKVLDTGAWAEGKTLILLFELESLKLPPAQKHPGPPIAQGKEQQQRFLKKHHTNQALAGPYIEEDRWMVYKERKHTSSTELLKQKLPEAGVAKDLERNLKTLQIYANNEVVERIRNPRFKKFLTRWLQKNPTWLAYG